MRFMGVSYGRSDLFPEVGFKFPRGFSGKPFDGVVDWFLPLPPFFEGVFLLIRRGYGENAAFDKVGGESCFLDEGGDKIRVE